MPRSLDRHTLSLPAAHDDHHLYMQNLERNNCVFFLAEVGGGVGASQISKNSYLIATD